MLRRRGWALLLPPSLEPHLSLSECSWEIKRQVLKAQPQRSVLLSGQGGLPTCPQSTGLWGHRRGCNSQHCPVCYCSFLKIRFPVEAFKICISPPENPRDVGGWGWRRVGRTPLVTPPCPVCHQSTGLAVGSIIDRKLDRAGSSPAVSSISPRVCGRTSSFQASEDAAQERTVATR